MDKQQQAKSRSLEMRTSILEEGMEIVEERMTGICFDFKIHLAQFNIMNEWISSKFGVELINKESPEYKHICADVEELERISARLSLQRRRQSESEPTMNVSARTTTAAVAGFLDHEAATRAATAVVEDQHGFSGAIIDSQTKRPVETAVDDDESESEIQLVVTTVTSNSSSAVGKTRPNPASKTTKTKTRQSTSKSKDIASVITSKPEHALRTCKFCKRSFARGYNLKKHIIRRHRGETPYSYRCDLCDQEFSTSRSVRDHMRMRHTVSSVQSLDRVAVGDNVKSNIIEPVLPRNDKKQKILRKQFACQSCHKSFTCNDQLTIHVRAAHNGEKPFSCPVCHQSFSTPGLLKVHMRTHPSERPFSCSNCHKRFASLRDMKVHMTAHTAVKRFGCPNGPNLNCHLRFRWAYQLRVHMRTHTDERAFCCQSCPEKFRTREALHGHLNWHRGEKPYSCTQCDSRFFSNENRYRHEINDHKKTHMNSCNTCGLVCKTNDELKLHVSQVHSGNNKIPSPQVGEVFVGTLPSARNTSTDFTDNRSSSSMPSMHVSQDGMPNEIPSPAPLPIEDTAETASNCPEARNPGNASRTKSKSSTTPNSNNTIRKKSRKPRVICPTCHRTFAERSALNRHMLLHTGEKPFRCSSCQKCFAQSIHLKRHMRTHTGEKPFRCHLCSKGLSSRDALDGHLNRHRGEKPYQCEGCELTFFSKIVRLKHTSRSHPMA